MLNEIIKERSHRVISRNIFHAINKVRGWSFFACVFSHLKVRT